MNEIVEPTLDQTRKAAEAARLANHAAYNAPQGDTSNIYDRTGAAHELLSCTEQLVQVLGEQAEQLATVEGLRTTEPSTPGAADSLVSPAAQQAIQAGAYLRTAAAAMRSACDLANEAWSQLSPLYVDQDGE